MGFETRRSYEEERQPEAKTFVIKGLAPESAGRKKQELEEQGKEGSRRIYT